jgi:hypothetical protein
MEDARGGNWKRAAKRLLAGLEGAQIPDACLIEGGRNLEAGEEALQRLHAVAVGSLRPADGVARLDHAAVASEEEVRFRRNE